MSHSTPIYAFSGGPHHSKQLPKSTPGRVPNYLDAALSTIRTSDGDRARVREGPGPAIYRYDGSSLAPAGKGGLAMVHRFLWLGGDDGEAGALFESPASPPTPFPPRVRSDYGPYREPPD